MKATSLICGSRRRRRVWHSSALHSWEGSSAALTLPPPFLLASALCAALSVLYSVPPARLKAVAGFDWLINMAGFGFLTPYAGWALTGRGVGGLGLLVLISFAFLFGASIRSLSCISSRRILAEATVLAVWLGISRRPGSVGGDGDARVCRICARGLGSGWAGGAIARWAGLLVAAAAWLVVLLPRWRDREVMDAASHQAGMHRALAAWAVTDMAVLFAWAR